MTATAGHPHRLLRFLVVGVGAAALYAVLSYALVTAGMRPFVGSTFAYLLAFAIAYTAQRAWTFGAQQQHRVAFPRYAMLQLGCAALGGAVSQLATWLGASPLTMSVLAAIVTSAVSYVASSRWVFVRAR